MCRVRAVRACVCEIQKSHVFNSGYEHLLHESPRRKPGWRFTAGIKYGRSRHIWKHRLDNLCVIFLNALDLKYVSVVGIAPLNSQTEIFTRTRFSLYAVSNGRPLVSMLVAQLQSRFVRWVENMMHYGIFENPNACRIVYPLHWLDIITWCRVERITLFEILFEIIVDDMLIFVVGFSDFWKICNIYMYSYMFRVRICQWYLNPE
jgi:hypothetical protein